MKASDAAYQFLTTLIWRWACVFLPLVIATIAAESLVPCECASWVFPFTSFAASLTGGLSIAFGLLAIVTAHQRAQCAKRLRQSWRSEGGTPPAAT